MSWQTVKIGDFLKRSKIPIDIENSQEYKRVTIRGKHKGVSLRDIEKGKKIGTKKQFILKEGQFILSKIDARYGAFGIAPPEVDDAIITGNFWAYDVDEQLVNIEWFNQYTNSLFFYDLCERASSGITHRKYLNEDFFLNHEIELPNLDEQESIIEVVDEQRHSIGKVSTELSHQLELVSRLRQAFLREAMQGKLVPQDSRDETAAVLLEKIKAEKEKLIAEKKIKKQKPLPEIKAEEIPFEIPNNWTWCRLGEICEFITKGTTPDTRKITQKGDIPYLKVYNIVGQKIDFDYKPQFIDFETHDKDLNRSKVFPDDVLMNIVGPPLGKVAIIPNTYPEWNINQALAIFRPIVKGISKYLYQYLCEGSSIRIIRTLGVVGQDNISLEQSRNMIFPLPPLAEQKRIVEKLEKLMKFCDELEANIRQSATQAETLLQVALKEALEPK